MTLLVLAVLGLGLLIGCGDDGQVTPTTGGEQAESGTEPSQAQDQQPTTTTTVALTDLSWAPPATEIEEAFAQLAEDHPDVVSFKPAELPEGAALAESWWPVALEESPPPNPNDSGAASNPRVVSGEPAEVRVVLRIEGAWVEIIQGVQGDLGNLPGRDGGTVAGHSASLHEALGAVIVQWSKGGLWYAVVGRGLSEEAVLRVANQMVEVG